MNINLLPWREERRQARDRKMLANGVLIWILCAALVFAGFTYFKNEQRIQNNRNDFLNSEISALDEKIKEIKELRARKDNLLVRMDVIQNLQQERKKVVHFFDDIVRKLPEGVHYNSMTKKKTNFSLAGTAQSNARVSDLMNRLDSSDWFENAKLNVIDVTPTEGVRLSEFKLDVSEEKGGSKNEGVN